MHACQADLEVVLRQLAIREEPLRHRSEQSDVRRKQRLDRAVIEEQPVRQELHQYTAQRPQVDLGRVRVAQDNLRRAVSSALHVGASLVVVEVGVAVVDHLVRGYACMYACMHVGASLVVVEVGASVVDHLDLARREGLYEDVLGLQIAMNDIMGVQHLQRLETLAGDCPQPLGGEILWQVALLDVLVDVVQVVAQQLVHNEECLPVVEDVE